MARHNGRQASKAPSPSIYDFSAMDIRRQGESSDPGLSGEKEGSNTPAMSDEDNNSDSDSMDLSDDTSSTASVGLDNSHAGSKRKLSDSGVSLGGTANAPRVEAKKPRRAATLSNSEVVSQTSVPSLPVEIWQRIFLLLSPAVLCRCLRVCSNFDRYLTSIKVTPASKRAMTTKTAAHLQDSEAVWAASRRATYPTMPRPLANVTELRMFQLITGRSCEACGNQFERPQASSVFKAGPGVDGIRVIYPFHVRLCGRCLRQETMTDVELLRDTNFLPALRRGLPYAFLTPDYHVVPELYIRQQSGRIPSNIRISKVYYKPQVSRMLLEYKDATGLGPGVEEEWVKGLDEKGKEAMNDALRWERWEEQLPSGASVLSVLREYDASSSSSVKGQQQQVQSASKAHISTATTAVTSGPHPLPLPVHITGYGSGMRPLPLPPTPEPSAIKHVATPTQRAARDPQQVQIAQQARRADIEKRCLDLIPPLEPNVLQHIQAFQAAIQIATPMTDASWEMLKPRILAYRQAAEQHEYSRQETLNALRAAIPLHVQDEHHTRPAKEAHDREYEQAQEPLRTKLGEYAEDRINGHWRRGEILDRDTAPMFAADVLTYVYERYLADLAAGNLSGREPDRTESPGSQPSSPVTGPVLSLDNMKWVFDNKVRSYTDNLRREIFICHGCAEEKRPKWFAFEGLIQHFGAKHTTAFSKGNVVVHWQTAEWPDDPPFHPHPSQWIKSERKFSNKDTNGRAKGSPQTAGSGSHNLPVAVPLLSDSPLLSAGFEGRSPGQGPHGSGHSQLPSRLVNQQTAEASSAFQVQALCKAAREAWDSLDGVDNLLDCLRVHASVQHAVTGFLQRFGSNPSLDVLTTALATDSLMQPIKSAHGLACRYCEPRRPDGSDKGETYYQRIGQKKLYNVGSLVNHFRITHVPQGIPAWDWFNVIDLPEAGIITELIDSPGMDDHKLEVVAEAFPGVFPSPLPKIGAKVGSKTTPGNTKLANRLLDRLTKQGQKQSKKKKGPSAGTNGREAAEDAIPEPKDDEYDPRKPMFMDDKQSAHVDLSKFDTDIGRQGSQDSSQPDHAMTINPLGMAPETLAALQGLASVPSAFGPHVPQTEATRSRSPSVGRVQPTGRPTTNDRPSGMAPDISAIIASLTGQSQASTLTPQSSVSSSRGYNGMPADNVQNVHGRAPSYSEQWRSSQHPLPSKLREPAQAHAVEPAHITGTQNGQDLLAALSRNTQQYEQNTQAAHTQGHFAAPSYYMAPPPQSQTQPSLRFVYEDELAPYPRPPSAHINQAYHDTQGHPSYTRYAPMPEDTSSAPDMHYRQLQYAGQQQVQERTIYIDEHGRRVELIPIDAPAPHMQYVPHNYGQLEPAYGGSVPDSGREGNAGMGMLPYTRAEAQGSAQAQVQYAPLSPYEQASAPPGGGFRYAYRGQ